MDEIVVVRANEVFGSEEKADAWLHRPLTVLGNRAPIEVSKQEPGVILQILAKIEWGVPP